MKNFDFLGYFLLHSTYYFVFTICLLWIFMASVYWKSKHFSLSSLFRTYKFELALPWLVVAVIAVSVQPYFNVPTFEMCGLGVAKSMFLEKTIHWRHDLIPSGEILTMPYPYLVDFKPMLFPFLLSLMHTLFGYNVAHVFHLNLLIAGLLLSAVYLCARRWAGRTLSCATLLLIASAPVFSMCARTAAADLFSAFLLGLSFLVLYDFMKRPTSPSFGLLWITLVLLAYGREENLMYPGIIMVGLWCFGYLNRSTFKRHWVLLASTPLLLLPAVWLRVIKLNAYVGQPAGTPLFSLEFFKRNAADFLAQQLNFGFEIPYNTVLHWLAVPILAWLFIKTYLTKTILRERYQRRFLLLVTLCLAAYYALIFSWFYAQSYTDSITVRFFLLLSIVCAVSPLTFMAHHPSLRARWPTIIFVLAACSFLLRHPLAAEGRFIRGHVYCQEADPARKFLRQYGTDRLLVVMHAHIRIFDLDCPAIDFRNANSHATRYLTQLARHEYRDIIVIQRWWYGSRTRPPTSRDVLDPAYTLEFLTEYYVAPGIFNRVSRVVPPRTEDEKISDAAGE